ncbi:hypothetical protein [Pseudobacteriovorax antillogorgiicola]|uniref:Lipoprotein n=1 Tax=Pseudobacteriovorax antillogorgiicola TaxID=1513793 RepID=A0A1Y6BEI0_9BACT|nr:hypothetical protein [Pseudobacteriovorax antillogorgiicola]TCS56311.1 hypothetical protein EDD56_104133 [Pseudobacteriovorax antillogorgiicola]SMF07209.1 hypothetical protein SAMN06296036_104200 [Pseudobacteriovorax antillogorgiicola]
MIQTLLRLLGVSLFSVSCVSHGPYFKLGELQELVKFRTERQIVVEDYGLPQKAFSDRVFHNANQAHKDKLVVREVDGVLFTHLSTESESDYNNMEFADWEKKPQKGKQPVKKAETLREQAPFVSHNSDITEVNDCDSRSRNIRYLSDRSDPNGYTERQFTVIYFDKANQVCGFKIRSLFLAH